MQHKDSTDTFSWREHLTHWLKVTGHPTVHPILLALDFSP